MAKRIWFLKFYFQFNQHQNPEMRNSVSIVIGSLIGALLGILIYVQVAPKQQVIIQESSSLAHKASGINDVLFRADPQRDFLASTPNDFSSAAYKVMPGVVFIKAIQNASTKFGYPSRSTGSGVVISADGYIVTNNHVVERARDIEVVLSDNRQYKGKIIGTDPTTDLALIKVDKLDLTYVNFGNSDSLLIGEWVMAVGNPFGLQSTVTAGIVSAKGRDINIIDNEFRIEAFIQTDAAVNPGNSGGALVNTNGELIGINTAIMTYTGRYEGYSFAVPGNLAQKVIRDLKEFGKVQRGLLGVQIRDINGDLARDLSKENVTELTNFLKLNNTEGVYVFGVTDNSGAQEAGLKSNDVILNVNDRKTGSISQLQEQIGRLRPGDMVDVEYLRNGVLRTTQVVLKKLDSPELISDIAEIDIIDELGFEVRDLTTEERLKFKQRGVRVTKVDPGSKVDQSNMVETYIITHVNNQSVQSVEDLRRLLSSGDSELDIDGFYEDVSAEYAYKLKIE